MNNINYQDIDAVLLRHDADLDAAEAHGVATGLLCLDERMPSDAWFSELFQQAPDLSSTEQEQLGALFEKTRELLMADGFEFDLFLPDDDVMLSQQLDALSNWCRGLLFGIGYGHASASWPGDSGEILKDVIEFTKLDPDSHTEDDEEALTEIHEYLRAAVLLLRDHLRGDTHQVH